MSLIISERITLNQEKGGPVELVVTGDEFCSIHETLDGYTVVYDQDRGFFCYAVSANGRLMSSGTAVIKPPPRGIRRHLRENSIERRGRLSKRIALFRSPGETVIPAGNRTIGPSGGLLSGRRVCDGNVRGLTILIQFADVKSNIRKEDVEEMLNGDNYSRNGNFCSVKKYYETVSGGKLHYENDVVGPITLGNKLSYYHSHSPIIEALERAVNEYNCDLSRYDSLQTGHVDALNIMYAGRTQYVDGYLWPHNSAVNYSLQGKRINLYMITSMGRSAVDLSIGTFCHETGHLLCRFPDLYDYGQRDNDFDPSYGMGVYCLMSAGNHLNNGKTPAPVCAYLRYLVNWYDHQILLATSGNYTAKHGDYGTVHRFETDLPNEFFLIENRSKQGLDTWLPSSGLAVYHCDTFGSNEWEEGTAERHYQCALLQADGNRQLENNVNYGDDGDLFSAAEGIALSHSTNPSTRAWDGSDSELIVSDIGIPGESIPFRVGDSRKNETISLNARPDLLIPDNKPEGIFHALSVPDKGVIKYVNVTIDISHTYIGDLQVELQTPSGRKIMLHDRDGSYKDDIRIVYNENTISALNTIVGESMKGEWRILVRDCELRDTGRLNRWGIEIGYESPDETIVREVKPSLPIPDNDNSGIASTLLFDGNGELKDIEVAMRIEHTYIGDLIIELNSPTGRSAVLHNQSGGSRNDIDEVYDRTKIPALGTFIGQPIDGEWTLRVRDVQKYDTGTLEAWSLTLRV